MAKKKGWIKCKDELPKNNRKVLICTKDEEYKICLAYRELDDWSDDVYRWVVADWFGGMISFSDDEVIAWQPLPRCCKGE